MKLVEWKTYRTRFLVKAKQLSSALSFTDHLGRQHCGRKGDYLVESSDGVLSIAPRQIFEDIYVVMNHREGPSTATSSRSAVPSRGKSASDHLRFEPLQIERIGSPDFDSPDEVPPVEPPRRSDPERASRVHRKSPQPVRVTSSRLGLM